MTGHKGNSEFCFPETLNVPSGNIEVEGKQNSLFPEGPVSKAGVNVKAVLRSLNTAFLPISRSRFKRH